MEMGEESYDPVRMYWRYALRNRVKARFFSPYRAIPTVAVSIVQFVWKHKAHDPFAEMWIALGIIVAVYFVLFALESLWKFVASTPPKIYGEQIEVIQRYIGQLGALEKDAPRLFLEYSNAAAAQYAMTFSGLFLKNDGGRAFNVEFEPEIHGRYTLLMDNPTQSIDRGDKYAVHLKLCEERNGILNPIGGMLSDQIQTLFDRLADEGEADDGLRVTIKCIDYDKKPFVAETVLRRDRWTKQIRCERVYGD